MHLVSIIIPTYGRPELLERAVKSVLAQTYGAYEIIVVDDNDPASEERRQTEQVMEQLLAIPSVRYLRHECNKNGAAARNTGIFSARGEWIAFLDDDDTFRPEKLEKQVQFMQAHTELGGVYCWYTQKGMPQKPCASGDLTREFLMCRQIAPTPTLFLKKSALTAIHGFDESYVRHQDIEMMLRFFENNTIAPVKEVLTEIGSSGGKNEVHGKDLEKLKDKFLEKFADAIRKQPVKVRKKIYCANYAKVWADYIHRGRFSDAWRIYRSWAGKYPLTFSAECIRLVFIHIKVRCGR